MSRPSNTMRPRLGVKNLLKRLKQVVLPAPLGPIMAWILPRATRRLTPRTATKPAKSLARSSVSRTVSFATMFPHDRHFPQDPAGRKGKRRRSETAAPDDVQAAWFFLAWSIYPETVHIVTRGGMY